MSYTSVILTKPLDFKNNSDAIIAEANKFAQFLAKSDQDGKAMSTTQLRRFYGEVKRIQLNGYDSTEVKLLKPKLAYAVGRNKKDSKIKDFYNIISVAIDNINDESSFGSFIKMFEAIVAYHKLYGNNQ